MPEVEMRKRQESTPRFVWLFSGHMIDAPDRLVPRFPAHRESVAAQAIAKTLKKFAAGPHDLAICGGACGGDLLFAEACLARGMTLELYIPFDEMTFLAKSVDFADENWHDRFFAVKAHASLHVMPDERGPLPPGETAYERNNLRMLDSAGRFGFDKIIFMCLWNGEDGDGPGGVWHLMAEVRRKTQRIIWLDTRKLWG